MDENPTNPTPADPGREDGTAPPGEAAGEKPPETGTAPREVAAAFPDGPPEEAPPEPVEDEAPAASGPDYARVLSIVESLLLVSSQPLSLEKIGDIAGGLSRTEVREVVRRLKEKYPADASGILVEEVGRGLQFRTNPANQEHVRRLFDVKPPRFSRAALETLAIIAYKQPATRLEVEQIRGVDCAASLKTLMERRLIKVVGKKDVAGRPFLFGTTREFLEVFGLASLSDLPSMREIEEFLAASRPPAVPEPSAEEMPLFAAGSGRDAASGDEGVSDGGEEGAAPEEGTESAGGPEGAFVEEHGGGEAAAGFSRDGEDGAQAAIGIASGGKDRGDPDGG